MVKYNKKSFTLIEFLIVTIIIIVLSGISIANFNSYNDERTFNAQVSVFTHVLEQAKHKAAAGDVSLCGKNVVSQPTPYVDGYTVVVNTTDKKLILVPGCINTNPTPISYPIPASVAYVTPTFSLRFDGQNYQGTTRRFSMQNTTASTTKCKFVQIDETGTVTNVDCSTCPCPTLAP